MSGSRYHLMKAPLRKDVPWNGYVEEMRKLTHVHKSYRGQNECPSDHIVVQIVDLIDVAMWEILVHFGEKNASFGKRVRGNFFVVVMQIAVLQSRLQREEDTQMRAK